MDCLIVLLLFLLCIVFIGGGSVRFNDQKCHDILMPTAETVTDLHFFSFICVLLYLMESHFEATTLKSLLIHLNIKKK